MKMNKSFFSIIFFTLFTLSAFAQSTDTTTKVKEAAKKQEVVKQETVKQEVSTPVEKKPVVRKPVKAYMDEGSIEEQFDYMLSKSNRYQEYKVVKISSLNTFKSNVFDSLNLAKKNLLDSKFIEKSQNLEIASLKNELETVKKELEQTRSSKDSMRFLGMDLPKATYNTIIWILILGSLLLAGLCFLLFKRSNVLTVETKQTLEEVREELDTLRKNALVREQKLARKLQDEVIKNKNLGL
ncbi:hypothetical protein [Labilibaculum sp.]|uniref:hypothetical protein n=1 Tax=Labilibaculum sp. TaxID=2060723 RepID=UPI003567C12A